MKKMLFLALMLTMGMVAKAQCQDGPYGVQINGSKVVDAPKFGDPDYQGRVQYRAACVELAVGDKIKLINQSCDATWMVDLDPYGEYQNFEGGKSAGQLTCKKAGQYDFYIKLKENDDLVYVGAGEGCGEGGQGGEGGEGGEGGQGGEGGEEVDDVNYYAIGWINGADHGEAAYDVYEDQYLFVDGKLAIDCQMGSYIAIKDHMGNFYYSKTETTIANESVTMDWANGWTPCQKWAIPQGTNYIIIRSATYKGQLKLERVDKATYDAYGSHQAIENTEVTEKARKQIIDGQLRIIRGDKVFDATGRQL